MQNQSRHGFGSLDWLQKIALCYTVASLGVLIWLLVTGVGADTKVISDRAESLRADVVTFAAPTAGSSLSVPDATGTLPAQIITTPTGLPSATSGVVALPTSRATATASPTNTPAPRPSPSSTPLPIATAAPLPTATLVQRSDAFAQGDTRGVAQGPDGSLRLTPAVSDNFAGSALDSTDWQFVQWSPGGAVTLRDGAVTVNVAAIRTTRTFVHGTFEARAKFTAGPPPFQNLAWSPDLNGPTAILISEPASDPTHVYARVKLAGQDDQLIQLPVSLDEYHTYRIVWGASQIDFSVDDVLRATIVATLDTPMSAWISSATPGHALTVDWARVLVYDTPDGTFTSANLDAGGGAIWKAVYLDVALPPGTALTVRTRTSLDGRIWSTYALLGPNGTVISPPGRYLQYEIAFSGSLNASPVVQSVTLAYARTAGETG